MRATAGFASDELEHLPGVPALLGFRSQIDDLLEFARREMKTAYAYDYLVVNRDLDRTRSAVRAIVEAQAVSMGFSAATR